MITLKLSRLGLRFDRAVTALEEVDLEVSSSEFLVLAGANGAGKSALLRVAARLIAPSEGSLSVTFSEGPWDERLFREKIRLVVQHPARQLLGQTVQEELDIAARTARAGREELHNEVERFALSHLLDRPTHALSGGEQRRLALAGAIMGSPELLLFDEPFFELDYPATRRFLLLLKELHSRGCGILLATHDYHRTLAEADRMIILERGRIALDGPPRQVVRRAQEFGLRPPGAPVERLSWLEES